MRGHANAHVPADPEVVISYDLEVSYGQVSKLAGLENLYMSGFTISCSDLQEHSLVNKSYQNKYPNKHQN